MSAKEDNNTSANNENGKSVNFYDLYNKQNDSSVNNTSLPNNLPTIEEETKQDDLQNKAKDDLEKILTPSKTEKVFVPPTLETQNNAFSNIIKNTQPPAKNPEVDLQGKLKNDIQSAITNKPIENLDKVNTKQANKENSSVNDASLQNASIKQIQPKEETILKRLRTYKDDLAQVMTERKSSIVSIASAENERRVKGRSFIEKPNSKDKHYIKKVGIVILSTLLVVLVAGSAFYFYGKSNVETVEPKAKIESVVFADENEEFEITDLSRRQILNELKVITNRTQLSLGRIKNIFITGSFVDDLGVEKKFLVSARDFLNAINADTPASFLRSLNPAFMIGVHMFNGNQPFIILQTNFYENAFAGMLEWERYMKDNLAPLFGPAETTIPTGLVSTSTEILPPLVFTDAVIKNQDIRVLKNRNGEITLMYSFIDKNTIVITTNENTLAEVFVRHTSSR